jgi:hypothetical protein
MGEVVSFPAAMRRPRNGDAGGRPPETVFEAAGWRILEFPQAGQFVAVSGYCRTGVEIGRFDPRADSDNHHAGTEIAILTTCASDETLSRCAIGWLNHDGPQIAILGAFVVSYGGRYHFWRDAVVEAAAIGGMRVVRLLDGSIAVGREPEPVPLLDPFAALPENRRLRAFALLPGEIREAVLRWTDPRGHFSERLRASRFDS